MKEILNKLSALTVLQYSCTIHMNDIQSFSEAGCHLLGNVTNTIVNEDDSCLYSSNERSYFLKQK